MSEMKKYSMRNVPMSDPIEARVVEAMARAMCIAQGANPDANDVDGLKGWDLSLGPALCQYRAHLAMMTILEPPLPEGRLELHTDIDGDAKFIYVPTQE